LADFKAITVAGTHGKTTTAALISHVLNGLNKFPFAAVGGVMNGFKSSALHGMGDLFVAEADESDGSLTSYWPHIGVLNNIDDDHMDFYQDSLHLAQVFEQYCQQISKDGALIVGWDNPASRQIGNQFIGRKLAFGFTLGCDVRAMDYQCSGGISTFKAIVERDVFSCRMPLIGKHNVANALAALGVVRALEYDVGTSSQLLDTFQGVQRRLDCILNLSHLKIFDDYAHNPEKIMAIQSAIKDSWPEFKILSLFQPHRYSRTLSLFNGFCRGFSKSDKVVLLPVYGAGESIDPSFDQSVFAREIAGQSQTFCQGVSDFAEAVKIAKETILKDGPWIILTIGAGDIWKLSIELKENLA
jgi:UDP-N-acetylmuramate--alanine ligase